MTANIVGKSFNLHVVVDDCLIDIDFGKWQGLSLEDVRGQFSDMYTRWLKEPHLTRSPDGESLDNVRARVIPALNKIVKKQQGDVVLVSHRLINKVLILAALSLDNSYFWRIKQDVGSISVTDYQNGIFTLSTLNDPCHLGNDAQNREIKNS